MPTVAVVYERDLPSADRLGDVIAPGTDMLLIWREWGEQFAGGSRTHVVGDGMWGHVTPERLGEAIARLADL